MFQQQNKPVVGISVCRSSIQMKYERVQALWLLLSEPMEGCPVRMMVADVHETRASMKTKVVVYITKLKSKFISLEHFYIKLFLSIKFSKSFHKLKHIITQTKPINPYFKLKQTFSSFWMIPLILSSFLLYLSLSRDSKEKGFTSVFRGRDTTSPLLLILPVERLAFG